MKLNQKQIRITRVISVLFFLFSFTSAFSQVAEVKSVITNPDSYWQLSARVGYDFPFYEENLNYIGYKGGVMGGLSVNRYWHHWGLQGDIDYIRNKPKVVGLEDQVEYFTISQANFVSKSFLLDLNVVETGISRLFFGVGPAYKYQTQDNKYSFELGILGGVGIINGGETLGEGLNDSLPNGPILLTYHSGFDNAMAFTMKGQIRANYWFNEHWGVNIGSYFMKHFGVKESQKNGLIAGKYIPAGSSVFYSYEAGQNDYILDIPGTPQEEGTGFTATADPTYRGFKKGDFSETGISIQSIGVFAGVAYKFVKRDKPDVPKEKVVEVPEEKEELYCVQVKAVDEMSGDVIPNTDVALKNSAGEIINTARTDAFGVTKFCDVAPGDYTIEGVYEEINLAGTDLKQNEFVAGKLVNKEVLYTDKEFIVKGNAVECNTTKPISGISIVLENMDKGIRKTTLTDEKGKFSMKLPEEGIYTLYGKKDGYFSQKEEVNASNFDRAKTLFVQLEVCAEKADCGKAIGLKNILFDLNKYNIKEIAKPELNKLVQFLKDNPEVKVELGSHTDCRASSTYNQKLSQNRANSSVAYIVSQGISRDRITAKGYGETVLLNKCADEVDCSEEEHAINRRTEFKVICPD